MIPFIRRPDPPVHILSPEALEKVPAIQAAYKRARDAGYVPPKASMTGGNVTYNRESKRWEYPPICADGIQQDLDRQEALHAAEDARYRRVNGPSRTHAIGERSCPECRGAGIIASEHGDDRWSTCSRCYGAGSVA